MVDRPLTEEKVVWLGNDMAYPVLNRDQTPNGTYQLGLTKRELFAMAAMQGVCGSELYMDMTPTALAKESVLIADALLKELAK